MFIFESFTQNHISHFGHDHSNKTLNINYHFAEIAPWIDHIVKSLVTMNTYDHIEGRITNYFNGITQLRLILYNENYESLKVHPNDCICYNISSCFGTITVYKYNNLESFLNFNSSKELLYNELPRYDHMIRRIIQDLASSLTLQHIYKQISKYDIESFDSTLDSTSTWTKIFTLRCFTFKQYQTLNCNFENMNDNDFQIVVSRDSESICCELSKFIKYCKQTNK